MRRMKRWKTRPPLLGLVLVISSRLLVEGDQVYVSEASLSQIDGDSVVGVRQTWQAQFARSVETELTMLGPCERRMTTHQVRHWGNISRRKRSGNEEDTFKKNFVVQVPTGI